MKLNISVIVMAYNEEKNLEATVREISSELIRLGSLFEILVIDDGSRDGTGQLADRLSHEIPHMRVMHNTKNEGLGGVYKAGFKEAEGDFITFFPADGQFPADIIGKFLSFMDTHDMVLGYLTGRTCSALAKALSRAEKLLFRVLFGNIPGLQGIMMFRRSMLDGMDLKSKGRSWTVVTELIIRASRAGYRIIRVPTGIRPRRYGKSKVNNPRTVWDNLREAFELRMAL